MGHTIEIAEFLLLVAAVVAVLANRLRVPYSVGLVLAGIALAFFPFSADVPLTKDLIFTTLLPPLVFEAAFQLPWKPLRRDLPVILLLATLGVLLAAALTAVGMHYVAGWTWMAALVFGILIAATDPVSVIATFKESGVRDRLRLLVEAESLFNDGTAAVAFGIVVAMPWASSYSAFDLTRTLVITAGGGIALRSRSRRRRLVARRPCNGSLDRTHLHHCRRLRIISAGRTLPPIRHPGHSHFRNHARQSWPPRRDHRQRSRSSRSFLGIRRLRRQLSDLSFAGITAGASKVFSSCGFRPPPLLSS